MVTLKQIIKTPVNHEVCIKIPDYISTNDLVEIILNFPLQNQKDEKIKLMNMAKNDPLFMQDLKEVHHDFKTIDAENWND